MSKGKGTISWFSNSPSAPTGYGVQTAQVLKRLIRDGYDVAMLSNYGREGINGETVVGGKSIPEYARGADLYSQDVTPMNHQHWKASNPGQKDLLITLYDVWIMKGAKYDEIPIASWIPVDHQPTPPGVADWARKPNVTPLAMSRFIFLTLLSRFSNQLTRLRVLLTASFWVSRILILLLV